MHSIELVKEIYARICAMNPEPDAIAGLPRAAIERQFREIDLVAPEFLIVLYEWHNGIYHLNAFLYFIPLEDAISTYRVLMEIHRDYPERPWRPEWFPVLSMNGDVDILFNVNTGALASMDIEEPRLVIISEHYSNYLNAIKEILDSNMCFYDEYCGSIGVAESSWKMVIAKHGVMSAW